MHTRGYAPRATLCVCALLRDQRFIAPDAQTILPYFHVKAIWHFVVQLITESKIVLTKRFGQTKSKLEVPSDSASSGRIS
jgi:hypothetical protein